MQCTPAEIERKRQEALKKLASKNISPLRVNNCPANQFSSKPVTPTSKFKFTKSFPGASGTIHTSKPYDRSNSLNLSKPISNFCSKESKDPIITAKCALQSEYKFDVKMSGYHKAANDVFQTMQSKNYDIKERLWSFDLRDYEGLIAKLAGLKGSFELELFPKFVLNCVRAPKRDLSTIDLSTIDPELLNSLMPFQREGVAFGIDKGGRCLIADDMGLGKTFQALGIASYYRNDWPLLIVTTASMKNTWEQTIINFLPSVPLMRLQYMVATKDYIGDAIVLIVSHDMLARALNKLAEKKFGVIIFDESHTFKNFKTKGTQAAQKLTKRAKRVILLSGTPALSRPSELYTQLSFIDSNFFVNFTEYSKRYCNAKSGHFGWDASGQSNLQELEVILSRKFMIRRTKDQVLQAMPNKKKEVISLDVKLNQLSKEDRNCLASMSHKYNSEKGVGKHSALLCFFSETARIKIPSVLSYILLVLEENKKFLVFAHHQIMMNAICQILRKKGKKFIRIDGGTAPMQRTRLVDEFQTNDDCACAVLSITAANAGITLTAAEIVVFAELHWNPSILSQAESRAHRIGQGKPVTIRYLTAKGTADDSIWPMLQSKQKVLTEAGLCKDDFNNVEVKKQPVSTDTVLTEGIEYSTIHNTLEISSYFESPSKKQKINDSVVSDLNDSLLEDLELTQVLKSDVNKMGSNNEQNGDYGTVDVYDMMNDGLDDILGDIDI